MTTPTESKLFDIAIRAALDADQLSESLRLALDACKEYRAQLDAAQEERDQAKRLLVDLMIVAKAWHLVWSDKFSPESNKEFLRVEREFLEKAKAMKDATP